MLITILLVLSFIGFFGMGYLIGIAERVANEE